MLPFNLQNFFLVKDSRKNEHSGISPITVDLIFTFLIAHCFFMAYGMTIDAILLNLCIDYKENDGNSRPYFMNKKLKRISMKIRQKCRFVPSFELDEGMPDAERNMIPMMNP
jgi:hypothetical protein